MRIPRVSVGFRTFATTALVTLAALTGSACSSDDGKATADAATAADVAKADGGDSSGSGADGTSGDSSGGTDAAEDTAAQEDVPAGPNDLLTDGDWFLGVQAAPFGDLKLPFKVAITAQGSVASGGKILKFEMRAIGKDAYLSDVIATAKNIGVNPGGSFSFEISKLVLPGAAAPTGTDVPMTLKFTGKIGAKDSFCGDLDGTVPDFSADLAGSKFKAVLFGKQTEPFESACAGDAKIYKGVESCPVVLPGENTLTSAERARRFIVHLPKGVTDTTGLPIILLYHGVGGEPEKMVDESMLLAEQAKTPFVLVAPQSERGKDGKALLKTDWYYGKAAFSLDNPDLVFFDDVLKCASGQFKTDAKRVYVTGMSGGGLISTFIATHRSPVVAAAAPFSGGYLHAWPKESGKVPFAVSWGGPKDFAYEQNFDTMAKSLIASLLGSAHPVISCNHGMEHKWPKEGGAYAAAFLLAHKLGEPAAFTTALGSQWPAYCTIAK